MVLALPVFVFLSCCGTEHPSFAEPCSTHDIEVDESEIMKETLLLIGGSVFFGICFFLVHAQAHKHTSIVNAHPHSIFDFLHFANRIMSLCPAEGILFFCAFSCFVEVEGRVLSNFGGASIYLCVQNHSGVRQVHLSRC